MLPLAPCRPLRPASRRLGAMALDKDPRGDFGLLGRPLELLTSTSSSVSRLHARVAPVLMTEQDRRRGQNEAFFRALNEQIERFETDDGNLYLDFVCECSSQACMKVIHVTRAEYEQVRETSIEFIVAVGHEQADIEDVVARYGRFNVVEKRGEAAAVAVQTDSRD
jgi:hypothetical protein